MSHLSEEQLDQIIAEERSREQPPLNEWRTIAARAREEGLIRESESRGWASQSWLQAAAAILLLVGGIAIGRTTSALPSATQSTVSNSPGTPDAGPAVAGTSGASNSVTGTASFASVDEASATLNRAIDDYERASQFLAARNAGGSRDSAAIYSARVAALEKIVDATESALQTAPHDPLINQYYLATMGARAATQQLVARPVVLRGF